MHNHNNFNEINIKNVSYDSLSDNEKEIKMLKIGYFLQSLENKDPHKLHYI